MLYRMSEPGNQSVQGKVLIASVFKWYLVLFNGKAHGVT